MNPLLIREFSTYSLGFLYKFVISYFFGQRFYPFFEKAALADPLIPFLNFSRCHVHSTDFYFILFDFALGYSIVCSCAVSYGLCYGTPMNFKQLPFKSKNPRVSGIVGHISLSFWSSVDYIFMRFVFSYGCTKKRWFKNRNALSSTAAYMLNMLLMGFWRKELPGTIFSMVFSKVWV